MRNKIIDTSDIPEADESWFKKAKLKMPKVNICLYTHKMWGGVFEIEKPSWKLLKVVKEPIEWEAMKSWAGWDVGINIPSPEGYMIPYTEGMDTRGLRATMREQGMIL